jgi:alginate O-acetyltransferase complex protein AlgI
MARGIGKMLGFDFCINFNYPYISKSITEFWRRWHISLSTWFRDYVYIPLGGNRVNKKRFIFNIITVWSLTGLWHGAGLTFVFWGVYYGIILLFEKLVLGKYIEKLPGIFGRVYSFFIIIIGWIFFASETFAQAIEYISNMFTVTNGFWGSHPEMVGWIGLILIAAISSTPLGKNVFNRIKNTNLGFVLEIIVVITSLLLSVAGLVSESYNPFLYFRF